MNNLKPSAIGCNTPRTPTLLGPFLFCTTPKIFRSSSVKKATAIKMQIIVTIMQKKKKKVYDKTGQCSWQS